MYLSNTKRFQKVILDLLANPSHIIPYFKYSLTQRNPIELGLPWWSLKSINKIKSSLNKDLNIFEWGSGGSTIFLSKYVKSIISVENNLEWAQRVQNKLDKNKLSNAMVLQKNINLNSPEGFSNCPYAKQISGLFDIIIIDGEDHFGAESKWSAREISFELSQKFITKNCGMIVVDDSWRYPKITALSKAKRIERLESIGPCRFGVTSTDIHFY